MINPRGCEESEDTPRSEFDDVLAMLLRCEEAGQQVDRDDWIRRYPSVADELREYLADRDELNQVVRPFRQALAPQSATMPGARVQYFGDYELLDEIGHGGMGVIYRARQVSLGRIVALKMISGRLADAARFKAEAQAAASLDDPHIVPIFEIGEHDGCSYYSMKFVEGGSLRDRIAAGPIEPRRAAEIAAMVASAVQVAHAHGILHRDLKPGNVLLDADGNALVADFGLAKNIAAESELTRSGDVLGTPSYMSPEQASGGAARVTTAADVYGLGGILYAMLIGKAPVSGDSPLDTLDRVRRGALDKPQSFSSLPRDLATICLKCLEREPQHRYPSAQAVAEELGRFLRREPIHARPAGIAERTWRWSRRNPVVAALVAAVAVSLVGSAIGGTVLAIKERKAREEAEISGENEASARQDADAALSDAVAARSKAEATLAEIFATYGLTAPSPERDAEKVLWFSAAARQAAPDSPARLENQLRVETYSRVAPLPVRATRFRSGTIRRMEFHPAGRHLLIESTGAKHFLWNLDTDAVQPLPDAIPAIAHAVFSPDGAQLALAGRQGHVGIFDVGTGRCLAFWQHKLPIAAIGYRPDGAVLAAASEHVQLYDCRRLTKIGEPITHPKRVRSVGWSKSGDLLATASDDGKLRVFPINADKVGEPTVAEAPFARAYYAQQSADHAPTFVLDDKAVLFQSKTGTVACADVASGKTIWRKRVVTNLFSIAVAPDGKFFFVGGDRNGATLDLQRGNRLASHGHRHAVYSADYRPDSQWMATASWDRTVMVWSDREPGPVARLPHQSGVTCVKFSPNGELLATAQGDGTLKLWRIARREPTVRRIPVNSSATLARFSADGRFVMATGTTFHACRLNQIIAYETATANQTGETIDTDGILVDAMFAPDVHRVLAAISFRKSRGGVTTVRPSDDQGRIQAWNLTTGALLGESDALPAEPRSLARTADGTRLTAYLANGEVQIFDGHSLKRIAKASTGRAAPSPIQYANNGVVRFTPDGRRVLLFGADRNVYVWDVTSGERAFRPLAHRSYVHDIDISSDSKTLIAASLGNDVRRWELATGKAIGEPLMLPDRVFRARICDGGSLLLTACRDNLVRLQNVSDGALAFPPAEHEEEVFDARLTPDGKWIASVSLDRTLRISSRRTGQLVMPPIELGGGGWCAEITPDGRYVVAAGGGKSLVIVDLAELGDNRPFVADAAIRIGEVLSGNSVDQDRIVSLNSDEWLARFHEARPAVAAMYPLSSEPAMPFAMPDTPVRLLVVAWIDRRVKPHFAAAAKWIEDELSRNRKL